MATGLEIITEPCPTCPDWERAECKIRESRNAGTEYYCDGYTFETVVDCPVKPHIQTCGIVSVDSAIQAPTAGNI